MAYRHVSTAYMGEEAGPPRTNRRPWKREFVPPWDRRRSERLKTTTRDAPRVAARDRPICTLKGNREMLVVCPIDLG